MKTKKALKNILKGNLPILNAQNGNTLQKNTPTMYKLLQGGVRIQYLKVVIFKSGLHVSDPKNKNISGTT